ncbi:MAG: sulfatase-like hydrolase/transferase [Magnetococcales bacterium]|nr:sulfatase-like hydrolase/transferase [Magnetococcales bacterium]
MTRSMLAKWLPWSSILLLPSVLFIEKADPGACLFDISVAFFVASFFSLLTRRPASSLFTGIFLTLLIILISSLKNIYTGARLVWHDIAIGISAFDVLLDMFPLVIYLVPAIVVFLLVLYYLERKKPVLLLSLGLLLLSGGLAWAVMPSAYTVTTFDFTKDNLVVFVESLFRSKKLVDFVTPEIASYCCLQPDLRAEKVLATPTRKPHIILILQESTFPLTHLKHSQTPNSSVFFDQAFPLRINVVGGATWVSETQLLHGVPPIRYGSDYYQINMLMPAKFARLRNERHNGRSIEASSLSVFDRYPLGAEGRLLYILKSIGYSTHAVYPVDGHYYGSKTMHTLLGTDHFLGCSAIPGCKETPGRYRPDSLFYDTALDLLAKQKEPSVVFLPTMRQHSPHDALYSRGKEVACDPLLSDKQCEVLNEYLARLKMSVDEWHALLENIRRRKMDAIVLAFGDHIPSDIASNFYGENFWNEDQEKYITFFTMWDSREGFVTRKSMERYGVRSIIDLAFLDVVLLNHLGVSSRYIDDKTRQLRRCGGPYCLPEELPPASAPASEPGRQAAAGTPS